MWLIAMAKGAVADGLHALPAGRFDLRQAGIQAEGQAANGLQLAAFSNVTPVRDWTRRRRYRPGQNTVNKFPQGKGDSVAHGVIVGIAALGNNSAPRCRAARRRRSGRYCLCLRHITNAENQLGNSQSCGRRYGLHASGRTISVRLVSRRRPGG